MEVTEALKPAVAPGPAQVQVQPREPVARQPSPGLGLRLPEGIAGRTWQS